MNIQATIKPKISLEKVEMSPREDMSMEEAEAKLIELGHKIINVDKKNRTFTVWQLS